MLAAVSGARSKSSEASKRARGVLFEQEQQERKVDKDEAHTASARLTATAGTSKGMSWFEDQYPIER